MIAGLVLAGFVGLSVASLSGCIAVAVINQMPWPM